MKNQNSWLWCEMNMMWRKPKIGGHWSGHTIDILMYLSELFQFYCIHPVSLMIFTFLIIRFKLRIMCILLMVFFFFLLVSYVVLTIYIHVKVSFSMLCCCSLVISTYMYSLSMHVWRYKEFSTAQLMIILISSIRHAQ